MTVHVFHFRIAGNTIFLKEINLASYPNLSGEIELKVKIAKILLYSAPALKQCVSNLFVPACVLRSCFELLL